ncbi:hypothetical protein BGZ81_011120 [Podila clonocystis]|nr:hypothetical protein BGZ81_011120 [Podila clonocystis]
MQGSSAEGTTAALEYALDRVTFQDASRNMRNPHTIDNQEYQGQINLSAPQAYYTDKDSYADAWADQGHFPLHLDRVSHTSIPARGGARITFTGENFREGVQIAFEYPRLGVSKVITPKVLKSTEMEVISPDLLEWCSMAKKKYHSRELCLSISLLCGGVKDADNATIEMVAREESESELLYLLLDLHRLLIQDSFKSTNQDAELTAKKRTLTLLELDQPPNVTRAEHLALSVIYMLCDGHDVISPSGIELFLKTSEEGHDMLHLAVILGLSTLAREIARHLLARFQSKPMTEDNVLFAKDRNGRTALDFARQLGNEEIEKVLEATLDAAKGFKKAVQDIPPRPQPILPSTTTTGSGGHPSPHFRPPSAVSTPQALHRPLPPPPSLTSPSLENGSTFSPLIAGAKLDERHQAQHYLPPSHPPPAHEPISHRINTPQAFVEEPVPMPTPKISHSQYPGMYAPPTGPPPPMAFPQYPPPKQDPHFYEPPRHYYPEPTHHPTSLPPASFPGTPSLPHTTFPGTPSIPPAAFPGTPALPPASYPGSSFPSMPVPEPKPSGQYSFLNDAPPSVHPVHPPPPLRANSSPLPQRPGSSNGSQSDIYNSPVNTDRPLPVAPFTPPTPLPPPKHIVTRVNRPKQFTIPQHQIN